MFFKKLAHMIMETDKSELCRAGSWRVQEEMMLHS